MSLTFFMLTCIVMSYSGLMTFICIWKYLVYDVPKKHQLNKLAHQKIELSIFIFLSRLAIFCLVPYIIVEIINAYIEVTKYVNISYFLTWNFLLITPNIFLVCLGNFKYVKIARENYGDSPAYRPDLYKDLPYS